MKIHELKLASAQDKKRVALVVAFAPALKVGKTRLPSVCRKSAVLRPLIISTSK
jgi:hypothetical protein